MVARIPITNALGGGDYTGQIQIGADRRTMNVLLDTGSSQLALDARRYRLTPGDVPTKLAQECVYDDGSGWTGAVIETTVSAGIWGAPLVLEKARVALAYRSSGHMFDGIDGILGLAYSALDDAREMKEVTWNIRLPHLGRKGVGRKLPPYLKQLKRLGVVSDRFGFYTRRSMVRVGHGRAADDIMNQGVLVIGGSSDGRESRDLFEGRFQTARVLAQKYYNTNLKSVAVGRRAAIAVRPTHSKPLPSNSIVDSGTNGIYLPKRLLEKMVDEFAPEQQKMLRRALHGYTVWARDLDLARWPDIAFVLQGRKRGPDARLKLKACDYWQVDAWRKGHALTVFGKSAPGDGVILGLPLMNGYFTIFDGEADRGFGEVRFARRKG
ncbi:MAG: A1 family peptidase [Alphaproteobacteria bacterium]|nr:A1 family peptidase [Alphaproteobacteria bacterium]